MVREGCHPLWWHFWSVDGNSMRNLSDNVLDALRLLQPPFEVLVARAVHVAVVAGAHAFGFLHQPLPYPEEQRGSSGVVSAVDEFFCLAH